MAATASADEFCNTDFDFDFSEFLDLPEGLLADDAFLEGLLTEPVDGAVVNAAVPSPEQRKRELRLHKNRIAASESRERKKSYVKDLESKCKLLESTCEQLRRSVDFVNTENAAMRAQLLSLQAQSNSGVTGPAVPAKDSLPLEFLSHRLELWFALLMFLGLLQVFLPWFPAAAAAALSTRAAAALSSAASTRSGKSSQGIQLLAQAARSLRSAFRALDHLVPQRPP